MTDSAPAKLAKRAQQRFTFWQRFSRSALASLTGSAFGPGDVADLRAFCLFVGYPRSGSTLFAALLNAHPDVFLGHELDVLRFVRWRATRAQILHAIKSSAGEFANSGRRWEGFDYRVGTPWEDGYRTLRVVGDKEAHLSTIHLGRDPRLLSRLEHILALPVKIVHPVRNPFDNIATMYLRGRYPVLGLSLSSCIRAFASRTRTIEGLKTSLGPDAILDVAYEDLVEHPGDCVETLCEFLDVEADPEQVRAATSVIRAGPSRSRDRVVWTANDIRAVEDIIDSSSAHRSYAGTSPSPRRITATASRRPHRHPPNFLVIGAQRCGTTLLHRILGNHAEVFVPTHRKEIHFFDEHYEQGERWYGRFFPLDRARFIAIGEVTPSYLSHPDVPERIHAFDPEMNIIAILRNPVERLWSAYHHLHRVRAERRSFTDFIAEDIDALGRGNYAAQLTRYSRLFAGNQLLVILFEDLVRDPGPQLLAVQRFLSLQEPWSLDRPELREKVNANVAVRSPRLYRGARRFSGFLEQRLGQDRLTSAIKRSRAISLFHRGRVDAAMTAADRTYLTDYYAEDVARLDAEFDLGAAATWGLEVSAATPS